MFQTLAKLEPEALIAFARERITGFKVPMSIGFIDVLPHNPSGKILAENLRDT
ncbi:hypothetical protein [Sandarakinorhabdus sp.]|uniref:hypothetical protein n=1 Tax=Sandarakinorhabdus sp. TaxID=1916663 RepID=UPI0035693FCB